MAQDYQIDISVLDKIPTKCSMGWVPFSKEEFVSSITKCNNSLTPGPDKLLWRYLKYIIKDNMDLKKIINITDTCFKLGHWPFPNPTRNCMILLKPLDLLYFSTL